MFVLGPVSAELGKGLSPTHADMSKSRTIINNDFHLLCGRTGSGLAHGAVVKAMPVTQLPEDIPVKHQPR